MFIKYMGKNLKQGFLGYMFIVLSEIAVMCVIMLTNGIIVNTVVENDKSVYQAKTFSFLVESTKLSDIEDNVNEFAQRMPYKFSEINMLVSPAEELYGGYLYLFYDYDAFKNYMQNKFDVSEDQLPTKEEFDNREKVVMAGNIPPAHKLYPTAFESVQDGYLDIMGEKYKVSGYYGGVGLYMLWGTQPDNINVSLIEIQMEDVVTDEQAEEILALYNECFDMPIGWQSVPKESDLLEKRANEANIVTSVLMIIISVFNTLLVFKYMLSARKHSFAVFRLCGFGKSVCILYSGMEFLIMSAMSGIIACVVFDLLIKPAVAVYYGIFNVIFDLDYYVVMLSGYVVISLIMFFIYIAPFYARSITRELAEM